MIVKCFGCMAIHNKALYKCLIHSFIHSFIHVFVEEIIEAVSSITKRWPKIKD